jgi:hypothetical protein
MSEAVAITGILVSGVVGPSLGAVMAQRQYKRARRSEREDDLLHMLDEVVLYVNRGRRALEAAAEHARAGATPNEPEPRAAWEQYADVLPPMRAAFQRIFVRLGRSSEIPLAIENVRSAFFALREPIDRHRDGQVWEAKLDSEYSAALVAFKATQDALYDAINERVGLPSDSRKGKLITQGVTQQHG